MMIRKNVAEHRDITVEICCGSYYDALEAAAGGADRIELNSALALGGLTPSLGELHFVKQNTALKVIAMARPRGAGFCYGDEDFEQMLLDGRLLMEHGADGVAFGCLREDKSIDLDRTERMVKAVKAQGGEAVFHRAFDCVSEPFAALRQLKALGVDRLLTSGLKETAEEGWQLLKELKERAGDGFEILAGGGIRWENGKRLAEKTGITQLHSSCREWLMDGTTAGNGVSYAYGVTPHEMCFDAVSREQVARLVRELK